MNPGEAIAAVAFFTAVALIGMPLARALAQRIAGRPTSPLEVDALRDEVVQLRAELEDVHARLADVEDIQNRLDFAERVIAQLKGKAALPGGP